MNIKPLGKKAYGSIPHLPMSRMGPADHSCHEGQSVICTVKKRDKNDEIIVTEKLDGACMSVAKINGNIVPLTRSGYHAKNGSYAHLRAFEPYVAMREKQFDAMLKEGQRACGEWLAMVHGTIYDLDGRDPFPIFDIIEKTERLSYDEMNEAVISSGMSIAPLIHRGDAISVDEVLSKVGENGLYGAIEPIEGAVWRVERNGKFDFIAKYVRNDKVDGKYLPQISGGYEIWIYGKGKSL